MKSTMLKALCAVATALAIFPAQASSTFHSSNDETGSTTHVIAGQLSRAERDALDGVERQRTDPLWVYGSEESGWELRPHSYDVRDGRIVHTDNFAHDSPRPTIEEQPDNPIYRYLAAG